MGRALQTPPPGFDELSVVEQIEYVQALWDRIAAREADVPMPEWHRAELDRRVVELENAPDQGRSWTEVETDLRRRLARER